MTTIERVGVAIALLLAGVLRLAAPTVSSFAYDEARLAQLALRTASLEDVATVGLQSSAGVPNFPLAVWVYALPFAVSADPVVAVLFTGLLNVLAVAGLWQLVRRAAGPWAGVTAAALYAGAPFAVHYSRAIWSQDILGPLAVAWAWAAVASAEGRPRWAPAALILLTGLAPQVHYAGAALAIPALCVVLLYRLWRRPMPLLVGGLIALCVAAPFLWSVWRSGALGSLWASAVGSTMPRELAGLRRLLEMAVGVGWEWFLLGDPWRWPTAQALALRLASGLCGGLLLAGCAAVSARLLRRARSAAEPLAAILPVWALSAPLLFLGIWTPAYHQYQLASLPAAFAVAGYAACLSKRRAWGPSVAGLALAVALVQGVGYASGLRVVSDRLTLGGMGTPLAYPRQAVRQLADGAEVIVHAHGNDAAWVGDVAGLDVLLWGTPHRTVDGRSVLLLPATSSPAAHLFFTYGDLPAAQLATELGLADDPTFYPRRSGEPPYVSSSPLGGAPTLRVVPPPIRLANGATLVSWQADWREGAMRLLTQWRIDGQDSLAAEGDAEYHQFHHLRSRQDGEPDAIQDVAISSSAWRNGDTLFVWTEFANPPQEPFWVEVGMYTWPEVARVPVLDRAGDPLAPIRLEIAPRD